MPTNALPHVIESAPTRKGHQCAVKVRTPSGTFTLTLSVGEPHETPLEVEIDAIQRAAEHLKATVEALDREAASRKARQNPSGA